MKNAFVIGRFQPFHIGHLALIEAALSMADKVFVVVGSTNVLPTFVNPLPAEERIKVLLETFQGNPKVSIHGIEDEPSNQQWVESVNSMINNLTDYSDPTDSGLFCGTKDKEYYEDNFIVPVYTVDCEGPSATGVRAAAYKGLKGNYESLLPSVSLESFRKHVESPEFERLRKEYLECTGTLAKATLSHPYSNPIDPVVHAALIQDKNILLIKRNSSRGYGQWAIPGGFLEKHESTMEGALRELKEETGVDLQGKRAMLLSSTVEENLDDLSVRTLGINYLFTAAVDEELEISFDPEEVLECAWKPVADVLTGEFLLFYNHNVVLRRLFSQVPEKIDEQ